MNSVKCIIALLIAVVFSLFLPFDSIRVDSVPLRNELASENDEIIREALRVFDPQLRFYLASIPIRYGNTTTARAQTTEQEELGSEHILVSYEWDTTYGESIYWDSTYQYYDRVSAQDPIFSRRFKLDLLVHEYLHHGEIKKKVDIREFSLAVYQWNRDQGSNEHNVQGNYTKYVLSWYLYSSSEYYREYYRNRVNGREEFAYIGQLISENPEDRLRELSQEIISYYRGVLRADLLTQKE